MESNSYEVRCERCHAGFAAGTRRCVHCGGPLGAGFLGIRLAQPGAEAPDEEQLQVPQRGRNLMWVVTAGLAVAFSLLRQCAER